MYRISEMCHFAKPQRYIKPVSDVTGQRLWFGWLIKQTASKGASRITIFEVDQQYHCFRWFSQHRKQSLIISSATSIFPIIKVHSDATLSETHQKITQFFLHIVKQFIWNFNDFQTSNSAQLRFKN